MPNVTVFPYAMVLLNIAVTFGVNDQVKNALSIQVTSTRFYNRSLKKPVMDPLKASVLILSNRKLYEDHFPGFYHILPVYVHRRIS